jgi:hypothetical protein
MMTIMKMTSKMEQSLIINSLIRLVEVSLMRKLSLKLSNKKPRDRCLSMFSHMWLRHLI